MSEATRLTLYTCLTILRGQHWRKLLSRAQRSNMPHWSRRHINQPRPTQTGAKCCAVSRGGSLIPATQHRRGLSSGLEVGALAVAETCDRVSGTAGGDAMLEHTSTAPVTMRSVRSCGSRGSLRHGGLRALQRAPQRAGVWINKNKVKDSVVNWGSRRRAPLWEDEASR